MTGIFNSDIEKIVRSMENIQYKHLSNKRIGENVQVRFLTEKGELSIVTLTKENAYQTRYTEIIGNEEIGGGLLEDLNFS